MDNLRQLKSQWDRVGAILFTAVGALLLILGYFGVSSQALAAEQIPYVVSGGLGGIFLMGVGAALWLSADLRDEWKKLDRIESVLEGGLERLGLSRDSNNRPRVVPLERDSAMRTESMGHVDIAYTHDSLMSNPEPAENSR
jgi:hypothetical protein